jgi:hypothetical protein
MSQFSGRWIFTVITAFVFAFSAVAGLLDAEKIMAIIIIVTTFYFNKERKA